MARRVPALESEISARSSPVVFITQQVSHYHAARYRAVARLMGMPLVISAKSDADFPEFLAGDDDWFGVTRLFEGDVAYRAAVQDGRLWYATVAALDRISPEIAVIAGWSFPESLAAVAWARSHGARAVLMSASQAHDGPRRAWREAIKRRVVSAFDSALVAGERQREYVVSLGMPSERVSLGYDAVDNDHFAHGADQARAQRAQAKDHFGMPVRYLLASARFIPKKNLPALVEAFAIALERVDRGHDLVVLGDGPERAAIEKTAVDRGIGRRVHLPGFRDYASLPAWYGLADGFVHVSLSEQWGLVVNEAAAAGLPLVVSRPCGSAAELVQDGVNGFLVDPNGTQDMAGAIARTMDLSDTQRVAMGEASRSIVSDWGPSRFARGLYEACQTAAAAQSRHLHLADRLLFRTLSRLQISAVS